MTLLLALERLACFSISQVLRTSQASEGSADLRVHGNGRARDVSVSSQWAARGVLDSEHRSVGLGQRADPARHAGKTSHRGEQGVPACSRKQGVCCEAWRRTCGKRSESRLWTIKTCREGDPKVSPLRQAWPPQEGLLEAPAGGARLQRETSRSAGSRPQLERDTDRATWPLQRPWKDKVRHCCLIRKHPPASL